MAGRRTRRRCARRLDARDERSRALRREPGLAARAVRRRLGRHRLAGRVRRPGRRRPAQAAIFAEEQGRFAVSAGFVASTIGMVGPVLLRHGTDAQRERYLRPLLRGDEAWCQLFSEPSARERPREPRDARRARRATSSSSTGRRCGRRTRTCATSRSCSPARTSTRRSTAGSRSCSSTCARRASRSGRCARSPAPRTSTRCSSPTCACPVENVVGEIDDGWAVGAGGARARSVGDRRWQRGRARAAPTLVALARELERADDPVVRQRLALAYHAASRSCGYLKERLQASVRDGGRPEIDGSVMKVLVVGGAPGAGRARRRAPRGRAARSTTSGRSSCSSSSRARSAAGRTRCTER